MTRLPGGVKNQGPLVQSIVNLTSSLVIKMLNVLVSTISNSQVFLLKKCECKSYSYFFSKNISICSIFNDQSFNDALTNDIVSFEQLGPDLLIRLTRRCLCVTRLLGSHYENRPIQIYIKFHLKKKNENFQIKKKSDIFLYVCSIHRLWLLVRTASARRF